MAVGLGVDVLLEWEEAGVFMAGAFALHRM
ncbi:hypothetical protein N825_10835 [Skermanella stibiiresistens SB22]|uniref:Uncharacterized protein n=1 Tax=Skermanella stibiiresistens SB22 TaxID=1385369 RepID=W9H1U4_9PROT|nr:hypothetical protein N825_10835 [Skermanella stibiiresistens SB22]